MRQSQELQQFRPTHVPLREVRTIQGDYKDFQKMLTKPHVLLILGKHDSGKTATLFRLGENNISQTNQFGYVVGFPKKLPNYFINLSTIDSVPNDCECLIDEIGIVLPAGTTTSKKQRLWNNLLMTIFHQQLRFKATVQNSYTCSVNILRQCDGLIIKPVGLFQHATERSFVKKICAKAKIEFDKIPKAKQNQYNYIYSDTFIGLVRNKLPSFWNQKLRTAWRRP